MYNVMSMLVQLCAYCTCMHAAPHPDWLDSVKLLDYVASATIYFTYE